MYLPLTRRLTGIGSLAVAFAACILCDCSSRINDTTVERFGAMLRENKTGPAFEAVRRLDPNDRSRHLPYLLGTFIVQADTDAAVLLRGEDHIAAFTCLNRIFDFPFAVDYLSSLERGEYDLSPLSKHLPAANLGRALGNYLTTYLHFRHTTEEEMPFQARATLSASIISRLAPGDTRLRHYRCQIAGENHITRGEYRKLRKMLRDSADARIDKCDSLFAAVESTSFNRRLLPLLYAMGLKYAPPSDFTADSITLEAFGRSFARSRRNVFDLWRLRLAPMLLFFSTDIETNEWTAALEALSMTAMRSRTSLTGSFTYVNPVTVAWCADNLVPDPKGRVCGVEFSNIYRAIFAPAVRLPALCYLHLANGNILDREAKSYLEESTRGGFSGIRYLRERFGYLSFPEFKDRDEDDIPVYLGFWLRRHTDGSLDMVWAFLAKILSRYDAEWFTQQTGIGSAAQRYDGLYVRALLTDLRRLDSLEGVASRQMEKKHFLFSRRLKWDNFVDPATLYSARQRAPAERVISGTGAASDSVITTVYDNGILIEEDRSRVSYHLVNQFSPTPNGLTPGMSRSDVIARLGTPAVEKPNFLQYHGDGGPIRVYFAGGGIYCISHSRKR